MSYTKVSDCVTTFTEAASRAAVYGDMRNTHNWDGKYVTTNHTVLTVQSVNGYDIAYAVLVRENV